MAALYLTACTTPGAVSKFTAASQATLASAKPVFADMKRSCLRAVNAREPIGSLRPQSESNDDCNRIGAQAEQAEDTAETLGAYFAAINSLASFGTAKAGSDASALAAKVSSATGQSADAQKALGSIAQFLTTTLASGYQLKSLERDLSTVQDNISTVVKALVSTIQMNYIDQLLADEERKIDVRYREFARGKSPEILLVLDDRWNADETAIERRRASARSLIAALNTISKAFVDLAANTHHLNAKEVPSLLEPYAAQMEALIPQVQKAY